MRCVNDVVGRVSEVVVPFKSEYNISIRRETVGNRVPSYVTTSTGGSLNRRIVGDLAHDVARHLGLRQVAHGAVGISAERKGFLTSA